MNTFCPIVKEKCKGNECVMWKDEKCLIINFLGDVLNPQEEFIESSPIKIDFENGPKEIPDEIKSATPEELAVELLSFYKKEFPNEENPYIRRITEFFWRNKGIERWNSPPEIQIKIEKAEMLAQKELDEEIDTKEKEQLEKEKLELPSLIDSCVDWARENGLKRVTVADVDAFVLEKNIEILQKTRRSLYAMTNLKLRSK